MKSKKIISFVLIVVIALMYLPHIYPISNADSEFEKNVEVDMLNQDQSIVIDLSTPTDIAAACNLLFGELEDGVTGFYAFEEITGGNYRIYEEEEGYEIITVTRVGDTLEIVCTCGLVGEREVHSVCPVSDANTGMNYNIDFAYYSMFEAVHAVNIEGATLSFNAGDPPTFTGVCTDDSGIDYLLYEQWTGSDGSIITSNDDMNYEYEMNGTELITAFDANVVYSYGVALSVDTSGSSEFYEGTKLILNGVETDFGSSPSDKIMNYNCEIFYGERAYLNARSYSLEISDAGNPVGGTFTVDGKGTIEVYVNDTKYTGTSSEIDNLSLLDSVKIVMTAEDGYTGNLITPGGSGYSVNGFKQSSGNKTTYTFKGMNVSGFTGTLMSLTAEFADSSVEPPIIDTTYTITLVGDDEIGSPVFNDSTNTWVWDGKGSITVSTTDSSPIGYNNDNTFVVNEGAGVVLSFSTVGENVAFVNGSEVSGTYRISNVTSNRSLTIFFTVPTTPDGVNVSGTLKSAGDKAGDATVISLTKSGDTDASYSTSIPSVASGKVESQPYEFSDVEPGTYVMSVSKSNHITREYTVVVSDSDVTQDVEIILKGDVNGNGSINIIDLNLVNAHFKGTKLITDPYILKVADVSGNDGVIKITDVNLVNAHFKGVKSLWN